MYSTRCLAAGGAFTEPNSDPPDPEQPPSIEFPYYLLTADEADALLKPHLLFGLGSLHTN
jgi:hypothetical protein